MIVPYLITALLAGGSATAGFLYKYFGQTKRSISDLGAMYQQLNPRGNFDANSSQSIEELKTSASQYGKSTDAIQLQRLIDGLKIAQKNSQRGYDGKY